MPILSKYIFPVKLPIARLAFPTSWFLATWFLVPFSHAATPSLSITYDASNTPLTITHDGAGVYSFDGLPYPGTVLYTPANGVVYYQHPEDPIWHTVTPAMLRGLLAPAAASQGPAGTPWQAQTTLRWNITTPVANPQNDMADPKSGTVCQPVFASTGAAAMAGLNVADLSLVLTTLQWLNAGAIPNPCEKLQYSAKAAQEIGLPTLFSGPNGNWQLQEIVQTSTTFITLPMATPMDDATRLRLLLVQFSPDDRARLLKDYGHLPVQQQIEAISPLLTQEVTAL